MSSVMKYERYGVRYVALVVAAILAFVLIAIAPMDAQALEVVKCTARTNSDAASEVLGGTETRVTWEGQCGATEELEGISLTFPAGTTFSLDNARITMLTGDDLMTRTSIEADISADGETFRAAFSEPADAGGYFRVEIYGVYFPADGGDMVLEGTYTTNGTEQAMSSVPAITVTGVTVTRQIATWLENQEWVQAWCSVKFLNLFLNPSILVTSFPVVLWGFFMAIAIVACAFPLAIPFGLLLALMRMARFRVLRGIAGAYVNVVRGTPLFLQIYIAFFGLPLAGIDPPKFLLGVVVLAMNSSAYLCEIFRAGIQSISKGQFEASRSLGMNGAQTMLFVIIPQTVRRVIPTMTSEFILLYKDTSMLAAVGTMEVVLYAKSIVASTGSITPYIVAACFYLVITLPLARLVGKLESRLAGNDVGKTPGDKKKRKRGLKKGTQEQSLPASGVISERLEDVDGDYITPEQMSSL